MLHLPLFAWRVDLPMQPPSIVTRLRFAPQTTLRSIAFVFFVSLDMISLRSNLRLQLGN